MRDEWIKVLANQSLAEQLSEPDARKAVEMLKDCGVPFSVEEVESAYKAIKQLMQKYNDDELDEKALENVTGGISAGAYKAAILLLDNALFGNI